MFGDNAILVAVRAPSVGTLDAYGDTDATSDELAPIVWTGMAAAVLRRARRWSASDAGGSLVEADELIVRTPPAPLVAVARPGGELEGSIVDVVDQRSRGVGSGALRFRVTSVDLRAAGTPVDSLRMTLSRLGENTA